MRYNSLRYLIMFFCLWACLTAYPSNYGLRLKSHDFAGKARTSLLLLGGKTVSVEDGLTISFNMDLRSAPIFGNILTINGNNGQNFSISIAPDENGKTYSPNLIIGQKLYPVKYTLRTFTPRRGIKVSLTFDKKANRIVFSFGGKQRIVKYNISNLKNVGFNFGVMGNTSYDIAPVDIFDVIISRGSKQLYLWTLRDHKDSISYDSYKNAPAVATDAIWLVDSHSHWQKVFSSKTSSELQYVYSQKKNTLYIFDDDSLVVWNVSTNQREARAINGGNRVMRYSKYLYLNEKEQKIYNFNLQRKILTSFDMESCSWLNKDLITDEPAYLNNTLSSNGGDVFYVFGGYGFYRYHNELFRINTSTGKVENLHYSPLIPPRTGSASVLIGNKLYIFGGMGNASGKQELNSVSYADLWVIDLKTLKAKRLWGRKNGFEPKMTYASQMLYNAGDNSFYVATSQKRIMRFDMKSPKFSFVGDTIPTAMDFDIMNYSLYKTSDGSRLLLVLDKYKNDKGHELEVFTIDLPILSASNDAEEASGNLRGIIIAIAAVIALAVALIIGFRIKRRKGKALQSQDTEKPSEENVKEKVEDQTIEKAEDRAEDNAEEKSEEANEKATVPPTAPAKHYYDRKVSSIRMLGEFQVYDKDGNDITSKFTPRTRNLMMMLFLHSVTKEKGIEIHRLDEMLWPNMSEESARNNRNVYMRRLRLLLEEVGKIDVVNDKINYRANFGKDVFFDFYEAYRLMAVINSGDESRETLERMLELLLRGPLLPSLSTEWLDGLKANYSNRALTLLHRLARRAMEEGKLMKAYHIADAIMVHDPFSEEALALQCQILCKRKTVGIAKIIYEKFCKTYEQAMGEPYKKSFADVCKGDAA